MALGSLHQKACEEGMAVPSQDIANKRLHFALLQCNKSVHLLRKLMSAADTRQEREICLIVCVLLIRFEILRGHYGTAMGHLGSGRKVLTEYLFGMSDCHDALVLEGAHFGTISPEFKLSTSAVDDTLQIPSLFADLQEARNYLDILINNIERFLTIEREKRLAPSSQTIQHRGSLLDRLIQWSHAISTFKARIDPKAFQMFSLLTLHHLYLHLRLLACFLASTTEVAYDAHHLDFQLLLNSASACLSHPLPSISLDIGIIQPLYYTDIRCRDPQTRRRVLALLCATPHREGMWDTTIMGMVAARVIQLEESESSVLPDVPERARFQAVYILLKGEGDEGGTLYCSQRRDRSSGKPGLDYPCIPEDTVWYQHELVFDDGKVVREVLGITDSF